MRPTAVGWLVASAIVATGMPLPAPRKAPAAGDYDTWSLSYGSEVELPGASAVGNRDGRVRAAD